MRDDQLTRLLRQVDEPAYPDAALANRLFEQLTREATRSRGGHVGLLLVAALLVVGVLAAGVAVGSGLLKVPWLTFEVTPAPSGQPLPSVEVTPSATPSNRPAIVPVPDGTLPALTNITVTHGPVALRDTPDVAAPVVGTIESGQHFQVAPLTALRIDGSLWFRVTTTDSGISHWIQLDPRSDTVSVDEVTCPGADPDLGALVDMSEWSRLACFGNRDFTLNGIEVSGLGGTGPGTFTPTWLASPFAFQVAVGSSSGAYLVVRGPDSIDVPPPPADLGNRQRTFEVIGHFDDAAASNCSITGIPYGDGSAPPADVDPANAVLYCREQFVATSITVTGTAGATALPTASAAPTPVVSVPDGILPPGSTATVTVDELRVRGDPSTTAPIVATLAKGHTVNVLHNIEVPLPVLADGLSWYEIQLSTDPPSYGWVAAGEGNTPFLALTESETCEDLDSSSLTLAQLIASGSWHRLACLGDTPVTVTGVIDYHCMGGARGGTYEPAWMVDWCPTQTLTPQEIVTQPFPHGTLDMVSAPGGPAVQPRGTIVRVTGHFNDATASDCVIGSQPNPSDVWDGAASLLCQEQFVITSIEKLGFIELPPLG